MSKVPTEFSNLWEALGPAYRTTLNQIARNRQKRGEDVTVAMLLRLWSLQLVSGSESLAGCAGTGIPFDPTGLRGPSLLRLEPGLGLEPSNVVLVSQGYFHLRTLLRVYGVEGHHQILRWMKQATEFNDGLLEKGLTPFGVAEILSEPPL